MATYASTMTRPRSKCLAMLAVAAFSLMSVPLRAQVFESQEKAATVAFLVRMQRQEPAAATCVIVYPDHRAHYEVLTAMGTTILEGPLAPESAAQIDQLLPALRQIDPGNIAQKAQFTEMDMVIVNVLTEHGIRSLQFTDPSTRKPFKQAMDPALRWLGSARKGLASIHTKASNCLPETSDKNPPLRAQRAGETVRAANVLSEHLLLRASYFRADEGRLDERCYAISPDGRYRYELQTTIGEKTAAKVYEGSLAAPELAELKGILDEPELRNSTHNPDPQNGIEARNSETFQLAIPREDHLQELRFYSITGVASAYLDDRSKSPIKPIDTNDKLLKPLRSWLKTSIEKRKDEAPLSKATANHCSVSF